METGIKNIPFLLNQGDFILQIFTDCKMAKINFYSCPVQREAYLLNNICYVQALLYSFLTINSAL